MNGEDHLRAKHGPLDRWVDHLPAVDELPAPSKSDIFRRNGVIETTRERICRLAGYRIPAKEIAREARVSPSRVYQILDEEGIDPRVRRFPILTKKQADVLAKERGGYSRLKRVNGCDYYYAVKSVWIPATEDRKGRVKQKPLCYLGPAADAGRSDE